MEESDLRLRALSRLESGPGDIGEPATWQERRSAQTRIAILEATIDSLVRHGYAETTIQSICDASGLSRGAMTHHFRSKSELLEATLAYTCFKRIEWIAFRIGHIKRTTGELAGSIDAVWESYATREYAAYKEFQVSARTNPDIMAIFLKRSKEFDEAYRQALADTYGVLNPDVPLTVLADFTRSVLEGLHANREIIGPERLAEAKALHIKALDLIIRPPTSPPRTTISGASG